MCFYYLKISYINYKQTNEYYGKYTKKKNNSLSFFLFRIMILKQVTMIVLIMVVSRMTISTIMINTLMMIHVSYSSFFIKTKKRFLIWSSGWMSKWSCWYWIFLCMFNKSLQYLSNVFPGFSSRCLSSSIQLDRN